MYLVGTRRPVGIGQAVDSERGNVKDRMLSNKINEESLRLLTTVPYCNGHIVNIVYQSELRMFYFKEIRKRIWSVGQFRWKYITR